ncbi:hypothetical protein [Candidatus Phytoplasma sp. AldY-WA1]|jgi:hypothetical protein|nr:hypothetical protein [Candidatus Phytoplasma sp. AldY-WA1]
MCMNKIELLKKIKYLNIELEGFDENNYIYWCEDLINAVYIMKYIL